jgi:hypothetical protein
MEMRKKTGHISARHCQLLFMILFGLAREDLESVPTLTFTFSEH